MQFVIKLRANLQPWISNGTSHKLNTKKRVEKSNLSFKLKIKKLDVEVRKTVYNDLSVYEAQIFENRQLSKTHKYLSSIRK